METMLMGDLINSKQYDTSYMADVMMTFKEDIQNEYGELLIDGIIPKVGDEYQCLCVDGSSSIRLAFSINEYFLKKGLPIRSRFVIAQGHFQGMENSPNWRFAEELYKAHELLHDKNSSRLLISLKYSQFKHKDTIERLLIVVDRIQSSWKEKDFPEISVMLKNSKFAIMSEELNKTKQQIKRRYDSLQIEEYKILRKSIIELCSEG